MSSLPVSSIPGGPLGFIWGWGKDGVALVFSTSASFVDKGLGPKQGSPESRVLSWTVQGWGLEGGCVVFWS